MDSDQPQSLTGHTISHYEILEKLGEGGMGAVYKARDTKLGRLVAVKVLIGAAGQSPEKRFRFLQEARAASALNHPNIITIYEIATAGDADYIIMELVRGETLHYLIENRRLSLIDSLKYSIQMSDALAAAHSAGIVHRDLKPANVMVTPDGLVKILDFGLAKLAESVREAELAEMEKTQSMRFSMGPQTQEGSIVGTVAYMAPEQAEGKKLDGRADIFSFGAVLYEMISGGKAFEGGSGLATLAAVLRDEPRDLTLAVPDLPPEVANVVTKCLPKIGRRPLSKHGRGEGRYRADLLRHPVGRCASGLGDLETSGSARGRPPPLRFFLSPI